MADELIKPDELLSQIDHRSSGAGWMDTPVDIRKGMYCYASNPKSVDYLGLPNARAWNPAEDDWKLPENWQEIIHQGFKERLERFRSFKVFMDICVRCGACSDKCHYFIGTGDPKNMPVVRAELLRSVYRNNFTRAGKILGKINGARPMGIDVLKEWWYYMFQCSECRRCSVFCPYGIDTAEITIMGRELLNLIGLNIDWIATPVANCYRTGNHLGIQPHAFKDMLDFFVEDIEEITGVQVDYSINKKGADILFITPSGDVFADPFGRLGLATQVDRQQGLFVFDEEGDRWRWDPDEIVQRAITDDVVDLAREKLDQLVPAAKSALVAGACISNPFEPKRIASLIDESVDNARALLDQAVERGVLTHVGAGYRFIHDDHAITVDLFRAKNALHWRSTW